MDATQYFQQDGEGYQQFRPQYPTGLVTELAQHCAEQRCAVDVGCGSGQLTRLLAGQFARVVGTDISASQIEAAAEHSNGIEYRCEPANRVGLESASVDLLTVAQAAHWFELPEFYAEAQRLLTRDGVLALISYGVPYIEDPVNSLFQQGYWQTIHSFWPEERRLVERNYLDLYFPFRRLQVMPCVIRQSWNYAQLEGYIRTWSAFHQARQSDEGCQRFSEFFGTLRQGWGAPPDATKSIVWPLSIRAAQPNLSA